MTKSQQDAGMPLAITLCPPRANYGAGPQPVDQVAAERLSREVWALPDADDRLNQEGNARVMASRL
ncbi:hypothetical protein [Azospirillum sp. B4]|uniref:hypothetical protein n=1 Tax=Azospirillum sp. B4 TaxID=95605 RepID=UPI000347F0D9|nr:hypothetical protein [Azospirillum sp. B4]